MKALERTQIKNWRDYLDAEISRGEEQSRVVLLFERCLIACALYEDFWLKVVVGFILVWLLQPYLLSNLPGKHFGRVLYNKPVCSYSMQDIWLKSMPKQPGRFSNVLVKFICRRNQIFICTGLALRKLVVSLCDNTRLIQ